MMNMGKRLREERQKKGWTQDQVAEAMNVSTQAISRWETGAAYPDITLVPGLAMLFDTTADALLGMAEIRDRERLNDIHRQVHAWVAQGEISQAEQLIRDNLKLYPNNSELLMALGETLAHSDRLEEAIAVEERVLTCDDVSLKARCTTMVNLLFLYRQAGQWEKAHRLVRALPHIWESREMMLAELDSDGKQGLQQAVMKALVFLCGKIDGLGQKTDVPGYVQLGVDFTPRESVEDMLGKLQSFMAE